MLLGVRFIASEFSTGDRQRGRIDTLGLDLDGTPTIVEYKRSQKDNVINQGLFYLDWLVDHKGDFVLAAQNTFGTSIDVNWSHPRLILIAESFSDYDKYAVNRIGVNIELWIYRLYGESLFYLEQIFATKPTTTHQIITPDRESERVDAGLNKEGEETEFVPVYTLQEHLDRSRPEIQAIFNTLRDLIFELADDENEIVEIPNKLYITYRHGKNFAEVVFQNKGLRIFLDIPASSFSDFGGIVRDVSNVGHWGTGEIEVRVQQAEDLDIAFPLIERAYRLTL